MNCTDNTFYLPRLRYFLLITVLILNTLESISAPYSDSNLPRKNSNMSGSGIEPLILKIDFSRNSAMVQDGFSGYLAEHENDNSFELQIYTVNGNEFGIDAVWPDGTLSEAKQMVEREVDTTNELSKLLCDWIGTDGRVSKVKMDLIISGLPDGLYEWKSYHHDNNDQTGIFNVRIKDARGVTEFDKIDISNGNLAVQNVTVFNTPIQSDGSDIIVSFENDTYPDNSTSFFVMNGLVISELDTTALPEAVELISPLNRLNYVSLNPVLKWTDSYNATGYKVFLGSSNPPEYHTTVESTEIDINVPEENSTYYWCVEAVNNNGAVRSEIRSFTTGTKNLNEVTGQMEVGFSHERGFYDKSFQLELTKDHERSDIIYTLDCSAPSIGNGFVYEGAITIDSTAIVKAALISGDSISGVYTNSYLFPESIAKQGRRIQGFPEYWGGYSILEADYEMDPEIINHPDYSESISEAFSSLPALSLSMDVDEWFNATTGLYYGYPNSDETREKAVSAEFIFNGKEENFAIACGVQNQGGTSIVNWKIPKQSMRLLFKEEYGPTRLRRKFFPDSEIESINTLVVDGLLYSWVHPFSDMQRVTSLYFRDQLASDLQNEMGGLSFHGRYANLFLNGLYWGVYDLHERPDDAFLSEYLDAEREDFDVIKHNPDNVVSGTNDFYKEMLVKARQGFVYDYSFESFQKYLDIPAFIDYMILNFYLGNADWAHQNYYAARNRVKQTGFRFYTWDAEHVIRYSDVNYNNTKKNDEGGPTEIHTRLKQNKEYRIMFADAVYKHLYNDGALAPVNFEKRFRFRADEIEKAVVLESARWGDFLEKETGIAYTKNDHWTPEVNKVLQEYIPKRRDIFIEQLRDYENRLFPKYMPPEMVIENTPDGKKVVELINPNSAEGDIYFTTDGSDPRMKGGSIYGQKYTDKIHLGKSSVLKARFFLEKEKIWSALNERIFLFDDVFGAGITINEIMYHPKDEYPEFIELMNFGENPVNIYGFSFSGGIEYQFCTNEILNPGSGIVLTNDTVLFRSVYEFGAAGSYQKQLSNKGETIYLSNALEQLVDSVTYADSIPWPEMADGDGYSIELKASDLDNSMAENWKSSDQLNGTPYNREKRSFQNGIVYPNPFLDYITIKLEEKGFLPGTIKIEVYNSTGSKVKDILVNSYNSRFELYLGDVLPGIYFVQVHAGYDSGKRKIVLKGVKI